MKKMVQVTEVEREVFRTLRSIGLKPLPLSHRNTNGPDVTALKGNRAFTIEIKKCRVTARGSIQVAPVETNRRGDDLIAIYTPSGYVLVQPMREHLQLCTARGYRTFPGLYMGSSC